MKENFIKTLKSGDIVILDNMSSHKVAGIRELIESVGGTVKYLPPYSPDKNPVELMWSKIKTCLRKAGKVTTNELIDETGKALRHITPKDAQGWYRHCGYYL